MSVETTIDFLSAALRAMRPRPPYWNNVGRVACAEIGDPVS